MPLIDYYATISKLKNLNSLYKFIISISTLILCIAANSVIFSLFVALFSALIIIKYGETSARVYLKAIRVPFVFLALSSLAILINISKYNYAGYNFKILSLNFYITKASFKAAYIVFFRSIGAVSSLYMLIFSTPSYEVIALLSKFRLPKILTELMILIYRFIFILLDTKDKFVLSSKSRMGNNGFIVSCRNFALLASSLLLASLKMSSEVYDAMEARCFDDAYEFYFEEKSITKNQIIVCIIYFIILFMVLILSKLLGGFCK